MIQGKMVYDGKPRQARLINRGESDAVSIYIKDRIEWEKWTFTVGYRHENY